ncbi:VAN3-binding protein-like [Olea europaea var. sylvestris]|uniref:VAN3-binding protein-like n=1 Tax=Olea europaea var. sylvestris TaxID=158386 RepID=UPI000C1CE77F|nr:VAN3-binding protein-like [Olea europaea var. sylvestris]
MDPNCKPTLTQAHPETMDFLSQAWCNFAIQALQSDVQDRSIILQERSLMKFENDAKTPSMKMEGSVKMDGADKFVPPWKSHDVKSWIWMQQAMHPELNYNSYFRRKWMSWKIMPFKHSSIKKWLKEIKQKRKEEHRLQKAEIHAAVSVAGVAAALAALAAENSKLENTITAKDSAMASAAALVAAQCAKVAEAMGAKREQLSSVIGSAMNGTSASEILTLTAAAATSLKGASTLKARSGYKNKLNESAPVLPLEDNKESDFDFEKCKCILSKGTELNIETTDGRYLFRSVAATLNSEAKVILKIRNPNVLNAFTRPKESIVLDLHTELYKDSEGGETETCYLLVLTTNKGMIKLDMVDDYQRYKTWSTTINHMLMLSTSFTGYELQFYKN